MATALSSILADVVRFETNIRKLEEKIERVEQVRQRTDHECQDLERWCKELAQENSNLKEAREKQRVELLRVGGGKYLVLNKSFQISNTFQ